MKYLPIICLLYGTATAQDSLNLRTHPLPTKQNAKRILWYVKGPNLSYGNFYLFTGTGVAVLNKKNSGVAFELKKGFVTASNVPADFEASSFFNIGNGKPIESTTLLLLSYVQEFRLKKPALLATTQFGVSYSSKTYPDNFVYLPPSGGWFDWSDNYSYDIKTTKATGLYLKPGFKYLFSKNIGLSAAVWTVLQKRNSYYGLELGLQFGKLR
jgi:hypothetical protein